MTKTQAIHFFGGVDNLASELGITRHAIYQWPEKIKEPRASQIKLIALQRANPDLPSFAWPPAATANPPSAG
jgi:hypothetical protein